MTEYSDPRFEAEENQDIFRSYIDTIRPCIVCHALDLEPWARQGILEAKRCRVCGMISVNPHLTEEGILLLYSKYFAYHRSDPVKNKQREAMYLIDRDWISLFVKGGKVLDVGCSGGFFLSTFPKAQWERHGVEIDSNAAHHAEETFGIPVRVGTFADMQIATQFDLVMMRGVIEHFKNPVSVLEKCAAILKPGGFLYITATPAGDSFAFSVYRGKWRLFTPLEHIHFFSVTLLSKLVKPFGLELVTEHYQYLDTPYADPKVDYAAMRRDIIAIHEGRKSDVDISGPFPGSMITALWRKRC